MSKDIINEDGNIEFKKSMTVETRSMPKNDEEKPEDYINPYIKMKEKYTQENS